MSDEWPTSADGYVIGCQIGQGAFARVMKAHCPQKDMDVAIKIMNLEKINAAFDDIRREVQMMRMTNHANILTCFSSFIHGNELWLVMRLMNMGSCQHVLTLSKMNGAEEGMKEEWVGAILKEVLRGLKYIHEQGQMHRDVKAGNLLLDRDGTVMLADFGVSGWLMEDGDRRKNRQTFVGTPCWMAPEVMEQVSGYDSKADIWSFGITALELAKGFAPYAKFPPMKVLLMTLQDPPPSLNNYENPKRGGVKFSSAFRDMVKMCLQKDPAKRPTAAKLLTCSFFKANHSVAVLRDELLRGLDDISVSGGGPSQQLPGAAPLYGRVSDKARAEGEAEAAGAGAGAEDAETDSSSRRVFVPGTTWVFSTTGSDDEGEAAPGKEDFGAEWENKMGGKEDV